MVDAVDIVISIAAAAAHIAVQAEVIGQDMAGVVYSVGSWVQD